jgi:hypothetical protein
MLCEANRLSNATPAEIDAASLLHASATPAATGWFPRQSLATLAFAKGEVIPSFSELTHLGNVPILAGSHDHKKGAPLF